LRTYEVLRGGLSHILNRQLSAGWSSWAERAAERAAAVRRLRMGVPFTVERELATARHALGRWRRAVRAAVLLRRSMARLAAAGTLHRGWAPWADWVRGVWATRTGRRLLQLRLAHAVRGWAVAARRQRAAGRLAGPRRVVARRAVRAWRARVVALAAWVACTGLAERWARAARFGRGLRALHAARGRSMAVAAGRIGRTRRLRGALRRWRRAQAERVSAAAARRHEYIVGPWRWVMREWRRAWRRWRAAVARGSIRTARVSRSEGSSPGPAG
jgi:hypothetical protein